MSSSASISQIQRTFGGALDPDVVGALLEMFAGDTQAVVQFLQAENAPNNAPAYSFQELQQQAESGLPDGYPALGPKTTADLLKRKRTNEAELPLDKIVRILSGDCTLAEHVDAQTKHYALYLATVIVQLQNSVEFSKCARPRMLAAAFARRDFELSDLLLKSATKQFMLPEMVRACKFLDAKREIRQLQKKLINLKANGKRIKNSLKNSIASRLAELNFEEPFGSLSGAMKKRVKRWVRNTFGQQELEKIALGLPKGPWLELCDLIHLAPSDFACPWFHAFLYDKPIGELALPNRIDKLLPKKENKEKYYLDSDRAAILCTMAVPYSELRARLHTSALQRSVRTHIASYETLETLLWFYEELECPATDQAIVKYLGESEKTPKNALSFGYGKLMERAMIVAENVRPCLLAEAQRCLDRIALPLESPCVVLGDASDSMSVAIRCATIVAAGAACLADAQLRFFNDRAWKPELDASDVNAVLKTALTTKATGLTCCAVALQEFYAEKVFVNCFVLVSDEIDNVAFKGDYFATLFQKYKNKVNPNCKIALISFRDVPMNLGRIHSSLIHAGIEPCAVVCLSAARPDTARIDGLLARLATGSQHWREMVEEIAKSIDGRFVCAQRDAKKNGALVAGTAVQLFETSSASACLSNASSSSSSSASPAAAAVASSSRSCSSSSAAPAPAAPNKIASIKIVPHNCVQIGSDCLQRFLRRRGWAESKKLNDAHLDDGEPASAVVREAKLQMPQAAKDNARGDHECIVCEDAESDTALLECGHFGFCSGCAEKLVHCPLCREPITRRVRIFKQ